MPGGRTGVDRTDHAGGWYWGAYPFTRTFGAGGPIPAGRLAPGEYAAELFDATAGVPHAYRPFLLTLG